MYHVLCNTHWQDSHEYNILRTVVTFQNTSNFDHYLSSHNFHKLGQIKTLKQSRVVYGFKEAFIMLTKLSCNILHHKPQTVSLKKKKMQRRHDFMLRPCFPVCKISIGKQPDALKHRWNITWTQRGKDSRLWKV